MIFYILIDSTHIVHLYTHQPDSLYANDAFQSRVPHLHLHIRLDVSFQWILSNNEK